MIITCWLHNSSFLREYYRVNSENAMIQFSPLTVSFEESRLLPLIVEANLSVIENFGKHSSHIFRVHANFSLIGIWICIVGVLEQPLQLQIDSKLLDVLLN